MQMRPCNCCWVHVAAPQRCVKPCAPAAFTRSAKQRLLPSAQSHVMPADALYHMAVSAPTDMLFIYHHACKACVRICCQQFAMALTARFKCCRLEQLNRAAVRLGAGQHDRGQPEPVRAAAAGPPCIWTARPRAWQSTDGCKRRSAGCARLRPPAAETGRDHAGLVADAVLNCPGWYTSASNMLKFIADSCRHAPCSRSTPLFSLTMARAWPLGWSWHCCVDGQG